MTFNKTMLTAALTLALTGQALAAVSSSGAQQLGPSLTRGGAEAPPNADGSFPPNSGGLTTPPAGFKAGDSMRPDPYAGEQPLQVITGKNAAQYQGALTATTAELLKRFPDFRVDVYPTHRSVALPQAVLDNTKQNALNATTLAGGMAVDKVLPGIPFPIPKSGAEAMWNFLLRYQGVNIATKYDSWNVDAAGTAALSTTGQAFINYAIYEDMTKPISAKDTYYQMKLHYTGPARRAGEAIMLRDAANPLEQPRKAWQYLPGQRRVKLAPNLAYDTPNPGTSGAGTYDDVFVFNGALDRFDWKLVGKQEMIVPYNTYRLTYQPDASALTTPNFLSPDHVRWEKHRVWVVEGNLKAGERHIYAKRRFYLDEDSWVALASDQYDARGQLYRGSFAFLSQSYDKETPDATPFMFCDLVAGSNNTNGVVGPSGGIKYGTSLSKAKWSPESLAGAGIR